MTERKGPNMITGGRMNGNLLHKQELMVKGINRWLISILKDTSNTVCKLWSVNCKLHLLAWNLYIARYF